MDPDRTRRCSEMSCAVAATRPPIVKNVRAGITRDVRLRSRDHRHVERNDRCLGHDRGASGPIGLFAALAGRSASNHRLTSIKALDVPASG